MPRWPRGAAALIQYSLTTKITVSDRPNRRANASQSV